MFFSRFRTYALSCLIFTVLSLAVDSASADSRNNSPKQHLWIQHDKPQFDALKKTPASPLIPPLTPLGEHYESSTYPYLR
jgi:hypothetical protein